MPAAVMNCCRELEPKVVVSRRELEPKFVVSRRDLEPKFVARLLSLTPRCVHQLASPEINHLRRSSDRHEQAAPVAILASKQQLVAMLTNEQPRARTEVRRQQLVAILKTRGTD